MKLYGYFRSSAAYRVRIALSMKGLDYEQVGVHLAKGKQYDPEFAAISPQNLVPGDKFTLFSQPLTNGASVSVSGGRATWVNNLAVDGSISVATVINIQPTLNFTNSSTNILFSWSDPFNSFKLQAQTNSINVGISSIWRDYPGGGASPVSVPLVKTNATVFYRLVSIP